jgi:uncharacterized membrane protein
VASHVLYAKATIKGHPIHAMIVSLPIAFYTCGLLALIAYAAMGETFWYRASMILLFAGVATALLAAVFGMIDLFAGIPAGTPARRTGVKHFGLHMLAAILFAGAAFMMYGDWVATPPALPHLRVAPPLVISCVAFVAMAVAAWLGWKLVEIEHVGVETTQPETTQPAPRPQH